MKIQQGRVSIKEGIVIGEGGGRSLKADIFLPPLEEKSRPAVLFIHGGGWIEGDRSQLRGYGILLARLGFVCMCNSYRLSNESIWPAQIQDVNCAIRYLRANATDLGLDPNRIGVSGNSAGGHLGKLSAKEMMDEFKDKIKIPVISAGGVGTKIGVEKKILLGFSGVSIGSPFIACKEAAISEEYKNACVDYGKNDIVISTKISGSPLTVINTPYVQKVGTEQNWIEKILSNNKKIKKWVKMITFLKGMKSIEKAAFSSTYKTVWCAGPSIEHTKEILSTKEIIKRLTT